MSARCLLLAFVLAAQPAAMAAKPPGSAAKWIGEAEEAYQNRKYLEAAEALKKAHALEPHPRLLYNIARAYDQAVETEKALEYYQLYLGATDETDPVLLRRAALAIDRLRSTQADAKEKEAERKRLTEEAARQKQRAEQEAEEARKAAVRQEELEEQLREVNTRRNRLLAYGAAGLGAAGLTTAIVMGGNALSSANDLRKPRTAAEGPLSLADKERLAGAARTQALVADVALVVTVAAAAAAVWLYPKGDASKPATVLVPTGNGVGLSGRF